MNSTLLFIENVGNLVCPSSYDLGEDLRLVLLSVTEGEDKPLKYPTIFNTADAAVITKMDLSEAVEFDAAAADDNIQRVRPGMQVFKISAKTISDITTNPPPLALIESIERKDDLDTAYFNDFHIGESTTSGERFVPLSVDIATCEDCLREMFDSRDRRYRYPFINCTNSGPRFTIIEGVPYDRARTTMRDFEMCAACQTEYENPRDRRFHAEPTACAACGPQLFLCDVTGRETTLDAAFGEDIIARVRRLLLSGKIVAIKGIGGFHLACDALDVGAVEQLRQKKFREDKPFAMMAATVEVIREYCFVSQTEEDLLLSVRRPVVLLERKTDASLPHTIAPSMNTLGFMLPYTPLYYLLFENLDRPLVVTSGNISDEPICYEDEDAVGRLSNIADYFLLHNRRIHIRADDSVTRIHEGREMILRRLRGYAPQAVRTAFKFDREILACLR